MAWKCPRCKRINHTSPSQCSCGQRVRSSNTSYPSRSTDDGLDLIDVTIIADVLSSDSSYNDSSSYDSGSSYESSYDSGSSSSDSGSSSCD